MSLLRIYNRRSYPLLLARFIRIVHVSIVFIVFPFDAVAQTDSLTPANPNFGKFKFFSVKFHHGRHYYTGSQLRDKLKDGYGAVELRVGWQAKGANAWEGEVNYPSYGIGWYSGYVGDTEIFGNPNAIFGFVALPITRGKRVNIQVEPALGLTYNLKPYNPEHNAINDAIGARFAVYFALHGGIRYRLTREADLLLGVDMTHFSNGRTSTPNMGLNMAGFSIGGCYHFNSTQREIDHSLHPRTVLEARPTYPKPGKPRKIREDNLSVIQSIGWVQNKDDAGTNHRYVVTSSVVEYQHKFNAMHGFSAGINAFVDPSARDTAEFIANKSAQKKFFPAAHIGYDFMFWRLSIKFQIGTHLTSIGRTLKGKTFIRPAIRYEFDKRLFAQIGLKTMDGATADWVEWGLGYKIFRRARTVR